MKVVDVILRWKESLLYVKEWKHGRLIKCSCVLMRVAITKEFNTSQLSEKTLCYNQIPFSFSLPFSLDYIKSFMIRQHPRERKTIVTPWLDSTYTILVSV